MSELFCVFCILFCGLGELKLKPKISSNSLFVLFWGVKVFVWIFWKVEGCWFIGLEVKFEGKFALKFESKAGIWFWNWEFCWTGRVEDWLEVLDWVGWIGICWLGWSGDWVEFGVVWKDGWKRLVVGWIGGLLVFEGVWLVCVLVWKVEVEVVEVVEDRDVVWFVVGWRIESNKFISWFNIFGWFKGWFVKGWFEGLVVVDWLTDGFKGLFNDWFNDEFNSGFKGWFGELKDWLIGRLDGWFDDFKLDESDICFWLTGVEFPWGSFVGVKGNSSTSIFLSKLFSVLSIFFFKKKEKSSKEWKLMKKKKYVYTWFRWA